jgi:hypothetical protein
MIVEGYFDESGDLDVQPGIFCISGYFIAPDAARAMHADWVVMLEKYQLGFFHMVDCAHGNEGFAHLTNQERIDSVTECIALIKKYVLEGFSVFANGASYKPTRDDVTDAYTDCADGCVKALELFLNEMRINGKIGFFFEKGHDRAGAAYNYLAKHIHRPSDTLRFASKREIPLLQAADLLAWQSCKYAKDYFYPRIGGGEPKRAPRKDFVSLMEHRHTFIHLHMGGGNEKTAGIELWPISMRAPCSVSMKNEDDGPVVYWREEGDDTPIIPVERPLDWRPIGGRMTYVRFEGMSQKSFALCLDDRRLIESIHMMLHATSAHGGNPPIEPLFPAEGATIEEIEGQAFLPIKLRGAATLAFHVPPDVISSLKAYFDKIES